MLISGRNTGFELKYIVCLGNLSTSARHRDPERPLLLSSMFLISGFLMFLNTPVLLESFRVILVVVLWELPPGNGPSHCRRVWTVSTQLQLREVQVPGLTEAKKALTRKRFKERGLESESPRWTSGLSPVWCESLDRVLVLACKMPVSQDCEN